MKLLYAKNEIRESFLVKRALRRTGKCPLCRMPIDGGDAIRFEMNVGTSNEISQSYHVRCVEQLCKSKGGELR